MATCSPLLKLKKIMTCSICLRLFNDPWSLPCDHKFCHSCILTHSGEVNGERCPLCRKEFTTMTKVTTKEFHETLETLQEDQQNEANAVQLTEPQDYFETIMKRLIKFNNEKNMKKFLKVLSKVSLTDVLFVFDYLKEDKFFQGDQLEKLFLIFLQDWWFKESLTHDLFHALNIKIQQQFTRRCKITPLVSWLEKYAKEHLIFDPPENKDPNPNPNPICQGCGTASDPEEDFKDCDNCKKKVCNECFDSEADYCHECMKNKAKYCDYCQDTFSFEPENAFFQCKSCIQNVCEECFDSTEFTCFECMEIYNIYCSNCGIQKLDKKDDQFIVCENCSNHICSSCSFNDFPQYCQECLDHKFFVCWNKDCRSIIPQNEADKWNLCQNCKLYYCTSCAPDLTKDYVCARCDAKPKNSKIKTKRILFPRFKSMKKDRHPCRCSFKQQQSKRN